MMRVSGVAIGEWNSICVKKNDKYWTQFKLLRAYLTGKISHYYPDGNYIMRYQNLNLLVSKDGIILTVWRDNSREFVKVKESTKNYIDENYSLRTLRIKSYRKHNTVTSKRMPVFKG